MSMREAAGVNLLAPAETRFPLIRNRGGSADDGVASRPFGLRFFTPTEPSATPASPSSYDEEQQVSVDAHGVPALRGRYAGWDRTSTGNMDGNEETKMDQTFL